MRSGGMIAATLACSLTGCLDTKEDMPASAADAGSWSTNAGSVKPPLAGGAWAAGAGSGGAPQLSAAPTQPTAAGRHAERAQAGASADAGARRVLPVVRAPKDAGTRVDAGVLDGGALDAGASDAGALDADRFDAGTFDAGTFDAAAEHPESASQPLAEHSGDLIISELMIDPKALSDAEGEWIELYNATDATLELRDCQLDDGAESLHEIPAVLVESGAFLTIAREPEPGFRADLVVPLSLTNSADSVAIVCQGHEIDRVSYDKAAEFAIAPGASLALDPEQLDVHANDAAGAWCPGVDAYATDLGSPGQANPSCHGAQASGEWEPETEHEPHDAGAYDAGETPADEY